MKRINKILGFKKTMFVFTIIFSAAIMLLPFFYKVELKQFQSLGLIGIGIINFFGSATVFFPSPAIVSVVVGGTLYNPLLVALFSSAGSSIGEAVGFAFGYSSKRVINHNNEKTFYKLFKFMFHKHASWLIITLSFIPNPIFDAVGIFAGVAQYPIKKFLLYVFIGRFVRDVIIAFFFSRI